MAFISLPSLSTPSTKRYPVLRDSLSSTGTYFVPSFSAQAHRRAETNHLHGLKSCAANGAPSEEKTSEYKKEAEDLVEKLDVKPLRWREIPFSNVEEELRAIEEYEREEDLKAEDVWPRFLRGAAYEYWGQPKLALAQYAHTDTGSGLRRVPELWERRGYNSFKVGKVGEADAYFDVAIKLFHESCGNELHFVHWFYSNFQDYIPKWNGPTAPIQRGICKYCLGDVKRARESFLPEIFLKQKDMEHAMLWFLACSGKMTGKDGTLLPRDMKVVTDAIAEGFEWNPRLRLFLDLFLAYGEGDESKLSELENKIAEATKADEKDDVATYVYLALYHDAMSGNEAERDKALDTAIAVGGTAQPNDTENFLFCAAKNRIAAPPNAETVEIPEKTTY